LPLGFAQFAFGRAREQAHIGKSGLCVQKRSNIEAFQQIDGVLFPKSCIFSVAQYFIYCSVAEKDRAECAVQEIHLLNRLKQAFVVERRRLGFVAILAFLAGVLFFARTDLVLPGGLEAWKVTGFIYLAVIVPVAFLLCVIAPQTRFIIEAVAITRFLLALTVFTVPSVGEWVNEAQALSAALVVTCGAILSRSVLHGRIQRVRTSGLRNRLRVMFTRQPPRLERPTPLQRRFTAWIDGTQPVCL
jgi:hypothetical protein